MAGADSSGCCAQCGGPITPRINRTGTPSRAVRRYCSSRCTSKAREARRPPRKRSGQRTYRQALCMVCGKGFQSYASSGADGGWTRCCSRECGVVSRLVRDGTLARRSRIVVVSHHGHCEGCGKHYRKVVVGQAYCTEACRPSVHAWSPADRICEECGQEFRQDRKWQRTCSEACAQEIERRHRRIAKSRRRAKVRGRHHEPVDPVKVFRRDGWRCQLCQKKLRPEDRGTYKPEAPELDHIISLAEGGTHTWGNVQCACRRCNSRKGATSQGQLGLPIAA